MYRLNPASVLRGQAGGSCHRVAAMGCNYFLIRFQATVILNC